MGNLTIAVAVISSFAFDTARSFAFGQIRVTMSTSFTDHALKSDQRMIHSRIFLSAVLPMPKQSLRNWTMSRHKDNVFAIIVFC